MGDNSKFDFNEIRVAQLKSAMKQNPILFSKINQPINLNSMIVEKGNDERGDDERGDDKKGDKKGYERGYDKEQTPDTYHASFMSNLKKFYKSNNTADVEILGGFDDDDEDDYIYDGLNYEVPAQIEGGDDATMDETNILQQTFGPFEYKKIDINDFYIDEDPTG